MERIQRRQEKGFCPHRKKANGQFIGNDSAFAHSAQNDRSLATKKLLHQLFCFFYVNCIKKMVQITTLFFKKAVTFHFFYCVAVTFVFEGFAQVRDALQAGQDESGQGFEAGVAGQEQAMLGLEVADVDCAF